MWVVRIRSVLRSASRRHSPLLALLVRIEVLLHRAAAAALGKELLLLNGLVLILEVRQSLYLHHPLPFLVVLIHCLI